MTKSAQGRVVAVQQQMFFAHLLSEEMEIDTQTILRKLAMAGLCLTFDADEIAVDAAAILPSIEKYSPPLRIVREQVTEL